MNNIKLSDNVIEKSTISTEKNQFNPFEKDDFFEGFIQYFIDLCGARIVDELKKIRSEAVDQTTLFQSLITNYKRKIYALAGKTLIHEFHQSFSEFDDRDESKYYRLFADKLNCAAFVEQILECYPVLRDLISKSTSDFIHFHCSIIHHYVRDYQDIHKQFKHRFGRMKSIDTNVGDSHNGGQSVAVIRFENGRLVYKPRSLKIDEFYREVIAHVNSRYQSDLRVPVSLDRGDYGWQEFIKETPCQSLAQVQHYYYELGMHLGFIYAFQGSDFHFENIIACGEKPVLVDLETLFQSSLTFSEDDEGNFNMNVSRQINKTVLKSTFFNYSSFPEENGLTNIGGVMNTENQPGQKEMILHVKTDKMSIRKKDIFLERGKNLPVYRNRVIESFGFEKDLIQGFKKTYSILQDDCCIPSLIQRYENARIRIIVRPTYVYAAYLEALLHPMYLQKYEERERVIAFIKKAYSKFGAFEAIYPCERSDMMDGDVPYFYTRVNSRQVFSSKGDIVHARILKESAKEEVLNRLNSLSREDMFRQVRVINMALSATEANTDRQTASAKAVYRAEPIADDVPLEELIHLETQNILKETIETDRFAQWLSIVLSPNGNLAAGPLGIGLYDGLSGVGVYLAAYYAQYQDERAGQIACKIDRAIQQLQEHSQYQSNVSAYYGFSSPIYFMEQMKKSGLYSEQAAKQVYDTFLQKLKSCLTDVQQTDFIGGLAGALKLLTQLAKTNGSEQVREAAQAVSGAIISKVKWMDQGCYWKADTGYDTVLAGFSHGITGICYSLSEYYAYLDQDPKIAEIIDKALQYEDRLFDRYVNMWKDNRDNQAVHAAPMWCHGSAGILLGRSRIHVNLDGQIDIRFIDETLNDTLEKGSTHQLGFSLCHGTLGNMDILNEVKDSPLLKGRKQEIENTISQWLSLFRTSLSKNGWENGIKKDSSSVGMMLGKTGQLYALLRLLNKDIPSILALD